MSDPTIDDVRKYWNESPLLSHELAEIGTSSYFEALDAAKINDSEKFALGYWNFASANGSKVLDIGCGPGWITIQYALANAHVTSVDLTPRAVKLTASHLRLHNAHAQTYVANAEHLPFNDNSFDLVVSSGVLHHTPDYSQAFREAYRVTRPGGAGKITLYRKGTLHHPAIFHLTRWGMKLFGVKHPGSDLGKEAANIDDFIRRYDGDGNPFGIAKTDKDWITDLHDVGWHVDRYEIHFFPKRFFPKATLIPNWVHWILDRYFGTMVYFHLTKPTN